MTLENLKVGDVVKLRDGDICIVLENAMSDNGLSLFCRYRGGASQHLSQYKNNLTYRYGSDKDIVAIHQTDTQNEMYSVLDAFFSGTLYDEDSFYMRKRFTWDYELNARVKMRLCDIEEKLGYKIELIK